MVGVVALTHFPNSRIVLPEKQLELVVTVAAVVVVKNCLECHIKGIPFHEQLVHGHSSQTEKIRLVHGQQWRR